MPNQQLITHARGHVTGEYAQNTIYLTGERVSDAGFYQNIRLSVQPSIGSAETCIRPAEDSGYNPRLFLGRMTDAPTEQILLSISSGGSGAIGYYSVYGYENGALRTLMTTAQYNNAFQYQVNYLAQYRVQVISLANGLEYLIDISGRSGEYLSSLYHTDGSLKAQQQGFASDLSLLYPADIAGNGVYALIGYQEISGLYRADALGYMINTLQWQNGRFALTNQILGVLGTQA